MLRDKNETNKTIIIIIQMAFFIRVIFSILFTFSIVKRALKRKTLSGSGSVAGNSKMFIKNV